MKPSPPKQLAERVRREYLTATRGALNQQRSPSTEAEQTTLVSACKL